MAEIQAEYVYRINTTCINQRDTEIIPSNPISSTTNTFLHEPHEMTPLFIFPTLQPCNGSPIHPRFLLDSLLVYMDTSAQVFITLIQCPDNASLDGQTANYVWAVAGEARL